MISIFANEHDHQILHDWMETNGLSIEILATKDGEKLGLSVFPTIVKHNGKTIEKNYAETLDNIMAILIEDMAEMKQG